MSAFQVSPKNTDECNKIIQQYLDCNSKHPLKRFLGECHQLESAVALCYRKQRKQGEKDRLQKQAQAPGKYVIDLEKRKESLDRLSKGEI